MYCTLDGDDMRQDETGGGNIYLEGKEQGGLAGGEVGKRRAILRRAILAPALTLQATQKMKRRKYNFTLYLSHTKGPNKSKRSFHKPPLSISKNVFVFTPLIAD
jgi:hypothetical protein